MKIRYSNIFASPYKYGPLAGRPAIHLELFGCNLTCKALNNPNNEELTFIDTTDGKFNRNDFKVGCSHRFAWQTDYFHATKIGDAFHIADELIKLAGPKGFFNRGPVVLSIGGGEPLLHQQNLIEILSALDRRCAVAKLPPPMLLSIETNVTQHLSPNLRMYFQKWQDRYIECKHGEREVHFLNSPKLEITGEDINETIVPSIVLDQMLSGFHQSMVFPTRRKEQDFLDIGKYLQSCVDYIETMENSCDDIENAPDYVMRLLSNTPYVFPVEVSPATEQAHQYMAMRHGYIYCRNHEVRETVDCLS